MNRTLRKTKIFLFLKLQEVMPILKGVLKALLIILLVSVSIVVIVRVKACEILFVIICSLVGLFLVTTLVSKFKDWVRENWNKAECILQRKEKENDTGN